MINIFDLTPDEAAGEIERIGLLPYKARQVSEWLYKKKIPDFSRMTNISKSDAMKLGSVFTTDIPSVEKTLESTDGTIKYLFRLSDGNMIESVLMKYSYGYSLCISSQAGCRMNCSFCASGKDGLARNLATGEMTGQIIASEIRSGIRISRIVVMGTGEPFDNYDNLLRFLDTAADPKGLGIGQRRITVSTCGLVPGIIRFADYGSQVNLAISLHETEDESRSRIMPVNKKYPIVEVLKACRYYIEKTNRRISFEYALIPGVNDSPAKALELARLLKGMLCYVNIIPVNLIEGVEYKGNPGKNAAVFYDILGKNGIHVTVRRELGGDIEAACGQLRRSHADEIRRRD
ncbi:MAG: 23S rRNA (adenine(2503)-C(2))-methyltransferase RlmN [Clostridia bacterium]